MPHEVGVDANGQEIHPDHRLQEMGHVFSRGGYDCVYGGKWHLPSMSLAEGHGFRPICPIDDLHLADRCIEFLRGPHERPFLLVASFDNPHNICEWTYDQPLPWGPVPAPPSLEACPNLPANAAIFPFEPIALRYFQRARHRMLGTDTISDEHWRRLRYAYYRLVEKVDREIGRILDALEQSGLMDETLVVFTSDHGEMMGAHRMRQKWVLFEESVRVPLIVAASDSAAPRTEEPGRTNNALVSNGLDLYPTFCDWAGREAPCGLRGHSLLPFLGIGAGGNAHRDKHHGWQPRDHVVAETYFDDIDVQGRMVRTERYKYIAHSWGHYREQLFDMEQDPVETINLAVESRFAGVLQQHRDLLRAWCVQTSDRFQGHYAHPEVPFMIPGMEYER
jgi:arylsulfatase A-like enzyme